MVIVEALKNIGGISYFSEYNNYAELNLRKHQAAMCPQAVSSHILAASSNKDNSEEDAYGDNAVTEEVVEDPVPQSNA